MHTWAYAKICDYWDARYAAIDRGAQALRASSLDVLASVLQDLGARVAERAAALPDDHLVLSAFIMAEDLYRSAVAMKTWDDAVAQYLASSVSPVCAELSRRGLVLRYVVDNSFTQDELGLRGPTVFFPKWYAAAGILYICPQEAAVKMMEVDGHLDAEAPLQLSRYIEEGRLIAGDLLSRARRDGWHFMYLDSDSTEASIREAISGMDDPGVITVLRNDPPGPQTKALLTKPPHLRRSS